jgi:predicted peptidase
MNRREFCSTLSATALSLIRANNVVEESDFVAKLYQNARGQQLPYQLFSPREYDGRQAYPLVLWLHGGAGRGDDNQKQITGGNSFGSRVWTRPEYQKRNPCFVVAPQCPNNQVWASAQERAQPSQQLLLALELLSELGKTFHLNMRRFYVTGQSLGGFGTWGAILYRSDMFAAAIPVCGGGDEAQAAKLRAMPVWGFHGEIDQSVPVERSRRMIEALRQAGGAPRYTEYKGAGHVIWERVFQEPKLLPWVFEQKRS